jgi:hypothetical protein
MDHVNQLDEEDEWQIHTLTKCLTLILRDSSAFYWQESLYILLSQSTHHEIIETTDH